jgi:uncharacterized protein (TIGR00730 family)
MMAAESTMFVALPGGLGTLEELAEIWTWRQLGFHEKPIAVLNVGGFYDGLLSFLDNAVNEEFLKPVHRGRLIVEATVEGLLDRLSRVESDQPALALEKT